MTLEQKISQEEKIPRRSFLKKTISLLGAATIALYIGIGAGIGCKSSDLKPPPPPPVKVTQTGRITDIFSKQPLSGLTIVGADSQVTTNSNGDYTFTYTKGTAPVLIMDKSGYVTRSTFPAHGPDYHNIPDSFNMTEFNNICRNRGQTVRWSTDLVKKPVFYITSYTADPISQYLKNIIYNIIRNDLPKISNNFFTSVDVREESDHNKVPTSNAFVFIYDKKAYGASCVSDDSGNLQYYARVELGGSNGDGSAHTSTIDEVLHEAGHGIGFSGHATNNNSIMWQPGGKPSSPTSIDIQNGTVLYDRPVGNSNPDNDPSAVASAAMAGTYEQAVQSVDDDSRSFSDPTGLNGETNRLRMLNNKPWEWQEYENTIHNARMLNEKQLREYEMQRNAKIREKH